MKSVEIEGTKGFYIPPLLGEQLGLKNGWIGTLLAIPKGESIAGAFGRLKDAAKVLRERYRVLVRAYVPYSTRVYEHMATEELDSIIAAAEAELAGESGGGECHIERRPPTIA